MVIIKNAPESNGAHPNQQIGGRTAPPEGWVIIPPHLEAAALPLLPWIKLTVEGGVVVAVEDDTEAREAWEAEQAEMPPPPLDPMTQMQLALAELAETTVALNAALAEGMEAKDLENKLAIAELAEVMLGGE